MQRYTPETFWVNVPFDVAHRLFVRLSPSPPRPENTQDATPSAPAQRSALHTSVPTSDHLATPCVLALFPVEPSVLRLRVGVGLRLYHGRQSSSARHHAVLAVRSANMAVIPEPGTCRIYEFPSQRVCGEEHLRVAYREYLYRRWVLHARTMHCNAGLFFENQDLKSEDAFVGASVMFACPKSSHAGLCRTQHQDEHKVTPTGP